MTSDFLTSFLLNLILTGYNFQLIEEENVLFKQIK